ncbi:MAG: alkaline phosphatase family protein [Planctomycetota bacterium]
MTRSTVITSSDHWRCKLLFVSAAVLAVVVTGCAGTGPLRPGLRPEVVRPPRGAVIFLCDGLQPDIMDNGCRGGWLPNIQHYFIERGTRVEHAITIVPSITYAAISTLTTGTRPHQHRILGNRWYDPRQRLFRNYAVIEHYRDVNVDIPTDVPTIHEYLESDYTVSIQAAHMRGVTRNIANWAQSGVRWFFGAYTGVDALTSETVAKVAREANSGAPWPTLLMCYYPGLDSVGHLYGPSSPEYRTGLEHFDRVLGRACDWLEAEGLLETTYIVLVSDHGMVDVEPEGYIDLMHLVRDEWGRNATDRMLQDGSRAGRQRYFDKFDTVVAYQDGRKALLYFAGPDGWDERPPPELVSEILTAPPGEQRLWNQAGIDLVAYLAGPNEVVVRSPRGTARILERAGETGPEYQYIPSDGDPLDYLSETDQAEFINGGYHSSRAWLEATCEHGFPNIVPHLGPLLREPRSGQVLVFTTPGYSFVSELGGHGGIDRAEMRVPFILAGPGIEAGATIRCACVSDLVPTLLDLLGHPPPSDCILDGVALFDTILAGDEKLMVQP